VSWRDDTTQAVQDDLDLLSHEALSAARCFLAKQRGVELEHRDGGPALTLLLPYSVQRRRLRRSVEVGELTAAQGERRVWTGAGPLM
jgi:hypothetical protein